MTAEEQEAELLTRASAGDAGAQAAMSILALREKGLPNDRKLLVAEIFARQSASQRHPVGFRQLAAVMLLQADVALSENNFEGAVRCTGRAVAIYDMMMAADQPDASVYLQVMLTLAEESAPGLRDKAVAFAKQLEGSDLAWC